MFIDNKDLNILKDIELLEYKILKLKNELSMLCDSDYYNQCDLIEQLEMQLEKLKKENRF